jgi:hypothetical protein
MISKLEVGDLDLDISEICWINRECIWTIGNESRKKENYAFVWELPPIA